MSAANTDNFMQVAVAGSETTLTAPGKSVGASSVNLTSGSGWPTGTGIIFALRRVDSNGVYVPGTYTEWAGVLSGTTITLNTTPIYGTDQSYAADGLTQAYIPVSASLWNRLVNTLLADHLQNGGHTNLHDSNGNVILAISPTASAVNDIQVSNNATTKNPALTAAGSDSAIGIDIVSKGAGVSRIDGAAPKQFIQNAHFNFVESGCVWSGDSYGSTRNASMTSGVVWINGKRLTVAAVTSRAFTASKDTYVDFQDNGDGTANITYTEVTNNATSPALPNSATDSTNVRNAIIITGASNIANSGSVNQGQETMVLPLVSSVAYSVCDGLGYLICPRDPNRKLLGMRRLTTTSSTANTTATQVAGLVLPVQVPTGRKVKVTFNASDANNNTVSDYINTTIFLGSIVENTNRLTGNTWKAESASTPHAEYLEWLGTPSSTTPTYLIGIKAIVGGTAVINAVLEGGDAERGPAVLKVELE